jgi:hypothetical protein
MKYYFIASIFIHLIIVGLIYKELKLGERWRVFVYPLLFALSKSHFKSQKGIVYHSIFYVIWIVFVFILVIWKA